jgi:hypothetical protein
MIPVAALLLAAATSQTADVVFNDSFEPYQCPETISSPTGTRSWRTYSDIFYLPNEGNVRHAVDLTQYENIWGHITQLDGTTLWPGVGGSSPTIKTLGKHEYVGTKFHVPPDTLPNLNGFFKHVMYGGGPPIDFAISRTCGDFQPVQGCYVTNFPNSDNGMVYWRTGSGDNFHCALLSDTDYYINIRITDPNVTGPNCAGQNCWSTIQNYLY